MKWAEYIKTLDWKDCQEGFEPEPGMVVKIDDYQTPSVIIGDMMASGKDVIDEGCGCCQGQYKPIQYAWISKEMEAVHTEKGK
ncbi:MAG: hypothetical protein KAS04_04590 [Candidatus Aenigmarchaeota archaeon]|nr:hypothetical protein [Candidatus Aenigmarchaeota archaeon]